MTGSAVELRLELQSFLDSICHRPLKYIYLEIPMTSIFEGQGSPKQGRTSNQNKGPHLGSRYISIYIYLLKKLQASNGYKKKAEEHFFHVEW